MSALRGIGSILREVVEATDSVFVLVGVLVEAPVVEETLVGSKEGVIPMFPLQDLDPGTVVALLLAPWYGVEKLRYQCGKCST